MDQRTGYNNCKKYFEKVKTPYKSDWFDKKDKIRKFEDPHYTDKLESLREAFEYNWNHK